MFSLLITAYLEPETVGHAIAVCLPQLPQDAELLVICPDEATQEVVALYAQRDVRVRHVKDEQKGKPAALNKGIQNAQHDLLVLTDGDVYVSDDALAHLLEPFQDAQVGATTARPISISPRDTMLGFWSQLLTDAAHATRQNRANSGHFLLCSGYLLAYRKQLMPHIPEDALAEDAVISHRIAEQGYRVAYASNAQVYIKYPTTYSDWLKQKVRSAGGYAQDYVRHSPVQMRSARLEVRDGTRFALTYPQTWRERLWVIALFAARLHLWGLVYWRVRVRKLPLNTLWQRVTSTK